MASAAGCWFWRNVPICGRDPQFRSPEPKQERNHHYKFDVDDNGLDINGFIVHHRKHQGKRHKFRVFLDSNENGRFDKADRLIGRTGLKQKHAAKGVGNLLDEGETAELVVDFKRPPSKRSDPDASLLDQSIQQLKEDIMNGGLDMQFKLPDGTSIPITLDEARAELSNLEKAKLSNLEAQLEAQQQMIEELKEQSQQMIEEEHQHAIEAAKTIEDTIKKTFDPVCWFGDC